MTTTHSTPILSISDLNVSFATEAGTVHAVRGINFKLTPGKVLGIVGESGCGKSVTSLAMMGLLPSHAEVEGSIRFENTELLGLSDAKMSGYRGNEISMIFQDPLSSLTPVLTIGQQIRDAIKIHNPTWSKNRIQERAIELLTLVGIPSPEQRLKSFPHEFSGGMRQRVMIAIAIANNPKIIICDEPTTALDVTIQAQILEVLKIAQQETGAAVIMITHDLGVVAGFADELIVMYAGKVVESGTVDDIFYSPRMPYTMGLLASIPRVDSTSSKALVPIHGTPPQLLSPPTGCSFADRCPASVEECQAREPQLIELSKGHLAACHRHKEIEDLEARQIYKAPSLPDSELSTIDRDKRATVLELRNLKKYFPLTKGSLVKRKIGTLKAVDGLSLDIKEGECLSIVGESGSGKTTALLEIMEFSHQSDGEILIGEKSNQVKENTRGSTNRKIRSDIQVVFQDPSGALDPRFTVSEVLEEPLGQFGYSKDEIQRRIPELMELVGLHPDHVDRFPSQFSGGQRQRIGIARALASHPKVVVLDEPVSALDVSVQAGVINLLTSLKAKLGLSYLLVAHDLSVVRHISDRVAVMYLGKIVEIGTVDEVFDSPIHPYTQALLSAIPVPDPKAERQRQRIILSGDLPSPLDAPKGCNFATRCPVFSLLPPEKKDNCLTNVPPLRPQGRARGASNQEVSGGVHAASSIQDQSFACFYPTPAGELHNSGPLLSSSSTS